MDDGASAPVHVYDTSVVDTAFLHQFYRLFRAYAQRQHVHLATYSKPKKLCYILDH